MLKQLLDALQLAVCDELFDPPGQFELSTTFDRALRHILYRTCIPFPHVTEQYDQLNQSDHCPVCNGVVVVTLFKTIYNSLANTYHITPHIPPKGVIRNHLLQPNGGCMQVLNLNYILPAPLHKFCETVMSSIP